MELDLVCWVTGSVGCRGIQNSLWKGSGGSWIPDFWSPGLGWTQDPETEPTHSGESPSSLQLPEEAEITLLSLKALGEKRAVVRSRGEERADPFPSSSFCSRMEVPGSVCSTETCLMALEGSEPQLGCSLFGGHRAGVPDQRRRVASGPGAAMCDTVVGHRRPRPS